MVDPVALLSARLGVPERLIRPLCRRGVRELKDMALWSLGDLEAVPFIGDAEAAVLVPVLRAAGVPLPDRPRV